MVSILALLAASAATGLQAAPPPIPDSAVYLSPISNDQLRRYAHALVQLSARAGLAPEQEQSSASDAAMSRIADAERARIIRANGLTPASFDHIAAQVRYNLRMERVVREELSLASIGAS